MIKTNLKHLVAQCCIVSGMFVTSAAFAGNAGQYMTHDFFVASSNSFCSGNYFDAVEVDTDAIKFTKAVEIDPITEGFAILEGPVWIEDGLVMSHIGYAVDKSPNPSNLVVYRDGKVKVLQEGYGSNGLTLDNNGHLVAARHLDGSITRVINGKVVASEVEGNRFNSPNDLVFSSKGNLYFTDPSWQNPEPTQQDELAYHVNTEGKVLPFAADIDRPNGVMLSKYEDSLYVGGTNGLFKYTLNYLGEVQDTPVQVAADVISEGVDGMSRDCGGNIYVVANGKVHILNGFTDSVLASYEVEGATNIAFGGKDHKTIYVTTLGEKPQVWKSEINIPGLPF
jgi:sugar lactone lactonase YvrE